MICQFVGLMECRWEDDDDDAKAPQDLDPHKEEKGVQMSNCRNIRLSNGRNVEMSKCRNVELSKYQIVETS